MTKNTKSTSSKITKTIRSKRKIRTITETGWAVWLLDPPFRYTMSMLHESQAEAWDDLRQFICSKDSIQLLKEQGYRCLRTTVKGEM